MKKALAILALAAIPALAQVGIIRSPSGIHAPSAKTLPQGFLFVSGSYEMVSDGKPMSISGFYTDSEENTVSLDKDTPSNNENIYASFGILDNLELGIGISTHYDGSIKKTNLKGLALGDLDISAKGYVSAYEWLHLGLSGDILAPTGSKEKGFRHRHRWYVQPNGDTYPYSSEYWAANINGHLTLEFKDYITFNAYVGILKVFTNNENFCLWGGGFNIFPNNILTLILEASAETSLKSGKDSKPFLSNPFHLTPALRIHLPYRTSLTISSDVGLGYFTDFSEEDGLPVKLKNENGIRYTAPGSPDVSIAVSISKTFDFSWTDDDNDGIINRRDMCPGTGRGMVVNERGCPVDEDQDGVLNIVDLCPGTPAGLKVDYNGCPLDEDQDGVPDYLDMCPNTLSGAAVDKKGCIMDTDNDGVDDNHDRCPNTAPGDPVGEDGCPLDEDHDGIPNDKDQCPHTPKGISIDKFGCPLDFDGDGVPDDIDRCPNTKLGEAVNEWGCPADSDMDGVPDTKDQCPDTPPGVNVNIFGCRTDQDNDGIFDEEDKCPNTPAGAPVDSLGCPIDSDGDGIADWADYCPGTYKGATIDGSGCPVNSRENLNAIAQRIHFKPKDTTLVNSSYTALNDIIQMMREHPMNLEIQCSASDASGSAAEELSLARARVIFNYIEKKGISEKRLRFAGFGKRLPPGSAPRSPGERSIRLIASQEP